MTKGFISWKSVSIYAIEVSVLLMCGGLSPLYNLLAVQIEEEAIIQNEFKPRVDAGGLHISYGRKK